MYLFFHALRGTVVSKETADQSGKNDIKNNTLTIAILFMVFSYSYTYHLLSRVILLLLLSSFL